MPCIISLKIQYFPNLRLLPAKKLYLMIFQPQAGSLLESTDTEPGRVWLFKSYLKSFRLSHAGISDSPVVMIYTLKKGLRKIYKKKLNRVQSTQFCI